MSAQPQKSPRTSSLSSLKMVEGLRSGILLLALLSITGCENKQAKPQLYPVRGTVKLDGKPLPNAILTFQDITEQSDTFVPHGICVADEQGEFSPWVNEQGDGLPAGQFRVAVAAKNQGALYTHPTAENQLPSGLDFVPERYLNLATSGIVIEVTTKGEMIPDVIALTSDSAD